MPKLARHALIWFSEQEGYALCEQDHRDVPRPQRDDESWFAWLAHHTSFSFQGRCGNLNLLKEPRQRGREGYWYAYRRQGKRTFKQYAGRTSDLSIARLEQLAQALEARIGKRLPACKISPSAKDEPAPALHSPSGETEREACQQVVPTPYLPLPSRMPPLLTHKLHPPCLHAPLVVRAPLLALLETGLERKLTLLSAPAGFGKTTLLVQWMQRSQRQMAWLSLDNEDNDPLRFLTYLIKALQQVHSSFGQELLASLYNNAQRSLTAVMAVLLSELTSLPAKVTIILDNYQVIEDQLIHDILASLLDHLPAHIHLVIASRSELLYPLARLRASGQITELRAGMLLFTYEEAEIMLISLMKLDLRSEEVTTLVQRTEGWVAGLQLAAFTMQGSQNLADCVATFAGSNRYVLAYLLEEVFEQQSEDIQSFLLSTSLLDRLNGSLCCAMTERTDAERVLEYLESANLFFFPHDEYRGWYRYHQIFAEALRHHLERTRPQLIPVLHIRASLWFEAHGLMEEAIKHALAAHDVARAATLVELAAPAAIKDGKLTMLQHWLAALPEDVVRSSPRLCITAVWIAFITSRVRPFLFWVDAAEQALRQCQQTLASEAVVLLWGEIVALRAIYAITFLDFPAAIATCRQALQQLPTGNLYPRGLLLLTLGIAYTRSVNVNMAVEIISEATRSIQATGHALLYPYILAAQAELYMAQGNPSLAEKLYQRLLTLATGQSIPAFFAAGTAHVGLGYLFWEWNNLEAASHHLLQAWNLGTQTQTNNILFHSAWLLTLISQAQGDMKAAESWLQQLELICQSTGYIEFLENMTTIRALFSLAGGRLEEALLWAQERHRTLEDPTCKRIEFEYFTFVRVLLAAGRASADMSYIQRAQALLERLRESIEGTGKVRAMLEILVLQALALQVRGESTDALRLLERAVTLGEPGRYIRLFVAEGDPMARLLRRLFEQQRTQKTAGQQTSLAYLSHLLKAFAHPTASSLPTSLKERQPFLDPLSWRECEVLRLMAAGYRNREIAAELVVVTGTVKAHINAIYRKLGVNSRVQAITRARTLGLL